MSNPISKEQMRRALLAKGFVEANNGDHAFYHFYHNGKKTVAGTKISRGSGYNEYDDKLFTRMKTHLRLDGTKQVRDLLECPMSKADYIAILKGRGALSE